MVSFKSTLVVLFILLLGAGKAMASEEADYTLMIKEGDFELRSYAPQVVAETLVAGSFSNVGNKAFMRLFKYITGNNTSQQKVATTSPVTQSSESEKIAMTSPVTQHPVKNSWAISFTMPAGTTLETLPTPNDPQVTLRQVPERHLAVIRYSGLWTEKGYLENKTKLEDWLEEKGYTVIGEPVWARYDPPFKPWFLRRNEVLLPIEAP
ncbi:SOUL family heme-binding protein [Marinospirillum minutulum]|uniref:SOUL family heme-binding protein n=1 Tax=Marinospirillum minutulum TaxID=64974 RepID=UPI0003FA0A18|nr:heme-binding protein [Marinospirillum minutulum]